MPAPAVRCALASTLLLPPPPCRAAPASPRLTSLSAAAAAPAVHQLISDADYPTLRGMVSRKLLNAVESTGADFRESGLIWRTDLEGDVDARMRGVSFWSRKEIEE